MSVPCTPTEKIAFIKAEIKRFGPLKRECKYKYKNWYKTLPPITHGQYIEAPKLAELDNQPYMQHYGKFYMTCLHLLYRKLRNCKIEKCHIINNEKEEIYDQGIKTLNIWIEERIKIQSLSAKTA